ncbi:MAG: type II toxin-antitoxin system Phd/YefM family antitoxin [bacterium]
MLSVAVKDFKDNLSKYLNEVVNGKPIFITKRGKVVAKVTPYDEETEKKAIKKRLAGSVKFFKRPTDPVGIEDWETLNETDD